MVTSKNPLPRNQVSHGPNEQEMQNRADACVDDSWEEAMWLTTIQLTKRLESMLPPFEYVPE